MIIQNAVILSFQKNGFIPAEIRIQGKKIVQIGENLSPVAGEEVMDAQGGFLTPGLIDAHSHICISEEGMGDIGDDCCDYSGPLSPQLEVLDGIYPFDRAVKDAVASGVTTACVCPGSDAVVAGVASTIRLSGTVADEMLVRRYTAMKCSLGENPKSAKYGFSSRMGTAYHFRKCLDDAIEYKREKQQAEEKGEYFKQDIGQENMLRVLNREMPIHVHAHRSDDICTAIRIAQAYHLDMVLVHCTDGIAVKDYLAKFDYPVVVGPGITPRSKQETWNKTFETAGVLSKAGLKVCITADHDVSPQYYLTVYAALAAQSGMDEIQALKAVTLNPAQVLGIDHCKGDIKEGMDADLVLWSGHPFSYHTQVKHVFIEGEKMV